MAPIPITIVTGFLGSGKTTLILGLVPQLRAANPDYRLALLKNEFGDLAVDSQLAASGAVAGVRELLNGCICCNLVGQLGDALAELTAGSADAPQPSRIVIETSGSAFPATLALEINRLARKTGGAYVLDGVVSVIDVENWQGYEDTSYTARLQARYTDLVVFNKWEAASERRFDECLDRLGDLHGGADAASEVAWVKSHRGRVDADLVFGIDGGLLARALGEAAADAGDDVEAARLVGLTTEKKDHDHDHPDHQHASDHQSEVDVLSVTLAPSTDPTAAVDLTKLTALLKAAPKDEVYRIKALLTVSAASRAQLQNSDDSVPVQEIDAPATSSIARYILNWAFGRWTFTPVAAGLTEHPSGSEAALRMTVILARYEATKWTKKLNSGGFLALEGDDAGTLTVTKVA
ncbi:vitamin b12 biosynthesis cobw-like protein [Grosmannia clavigera kw1407]|uniref:Vitamin b12 biosynthesis cobw-like protein n=1 Tax=Grosmannia clavigera (strain kw1407 / UAMH 11150) TaxID=655863 RepID=F0XEM5_GROCL|nr:vitamin b12 biosynthesis cobw-like protein [Grosmannia clavigera kw1407]EFX04495.1 vitamin b12 biosynthesis cobw-like protein [Grosmannia clavigera kw1407]